MEMIRCEDLRKTYGSGSSEVHAVDGISLSFEQGTFTAITGKSGSGKSTLLHLLSGLDRPTSGKVMYQDNNLFQYNDKPTGRPWATRSPWITLKRCCRSCRNKNTAKGRRHCRSGSF